MVFASYSDIGKVRKTNQDFYYGIEKDNYKLYIVADGMGGHNAGEVASFMAIKSIEKWLQDNDFSVSLGLSDIQNLLREATIFANSEIYKKASANPELFGMGTTITLALIINNKLFLAHVGDSRAYLINEKGITQLTDDHSLVAELFKNGSITLEEAISHPQKHLLTRALGTDIAIDVDIATIDINQDDIVLLCTDGLTNLINNEEIYSTVISKCVEDSCKQLVDMANDHGGYDNITVIVAQHDGLDIK